MKPGWMKKQEAAKTRPCPRTCGECRHLGSPVRNIKYKGKQWEMLYECAVHPGCFNTVHSIRCPEWELR